MVPLHLKINFSVLLNFRNGNAFILAFPSLKSDMQFSGNLHVTHGIIQE